MAGGRGLRQGWGNHRGCRRSGWRGCDPDGRAAQRAADRPAAARPSRVRAAGAARRSRARRAAGRGRSDRGQPRLDPADVAQGTADGRALVPGQYRGLQGGGAGRGHVRPVLPAADHGGRYRAAGLQAIGTARRLGAVVTAYDVRPETKTEVESLGATFLELAAVGPAAGDGGYARALTEDERHAQQDELTGHIARHDVVITTAQVPGRRPPVLVTADALKAMVAGSVVVDMAASDLGGNVDGSLPGETVTTEHGITVIGAGSLPSTMPAAASAMYARNISALLLYMMKDGKLAIDLSDELQAGVVISRDGSVIHPALAAPADDEPARADPAGGTPDVNGAAH